MPSTLKGALRYVALWGDEKGMVRQLYKAMNGVDNAAQVWNKHYHKFMMDEGFLRTSRDDCIYIHLSSTVTCSLYVDDILVASDQNKRNQLMRLIRRVQQCFYIRVLGEPTKFLGMVITYLCQQGICCVSQHTYIEKLASTYLIEHTSSPFPAFPTTPME